MRNRSHLVGVFCLSLAQITIPCFADDLLPIPLDAKIVHPQPMTGIVLWATNEEVETAPIQLEYSYFTYDQIVNQRGEYDWSPIEKLLTAVAKRKHQAIIRWHDTYVGKPTGVPAYIKALPDYREVTAPSEKKQTGFPDWSHPEWQAFVLDFFTQFAEKYDRDPRIAFVQVGFGLWSEYHIYDGPMKLGGTFPSLEYQREFARHLSGKFHQTPWMISVDAAGDHAPYAGDKSLRALPFGVFDDSFNHRTHKKENEPNWNLFGRDRWKTQPAGGEFSFYVAKDQKDALSPTGPHGIPFEQQAAKFHVSFIIGDAQPDYQSRERLIEASLACGYRFRVTRLVASSSESQVTIENTGIAPIYYDAFPAIDGKRSEQSLKGLLPGELRTFDIAAGGSEPRLTIECDRLVPGQRIGFDAALPLGAVSPGQ